MQFKITLYPGSYEIFASSEQTILDAVLSAGYVLPYGCRNGACGLCKGKLLQGSVTYPENEALPLTLDEKHENWALFCSAYPQSDLVIESSALMQGLQSQPKIYPCRVESRERLSENIMLMFLKLPNQEMMPFTAGQYIDFILKDGKKRSFSLANAPHEKDFLELHLKLVPGGQFTEYVFKEIKEKAILRIMGPLGTFYLRDSDKPLIFVAGGTGFAPIKAIISDMLFQKNPRSITLYRGAAQLNDLYLHELSLAWHEFATLRYVPVLSAPQPQDRWRGRVGLVHQAVLADIPNLADYQVYCCGLPEMVEAARKDFVAEGLPEQEFFSDIFTFSPPTPS